MSIHSEETIRTLRQMRAAGESYGAMQEALGLVSRDAAAGMVSRYCKDIPNPKRTAALAPEPHVQPARAPSVRRAATKPTAVPPPPSAPLLVLVSTRPARMPVPPSVDPVHFVHAKGCRWPLWSATAAFDDKKVCDAPCREGQSFCETHRVLAYRPKERRVA